MRSGPRCSGSRTTRHGCPSSISRSGGTPSRSGVSTGRRPITSASWSPKGSASSAVRRLRTGSPECRPRSGRRPRPRQGARRRRSLLIRSARSSNYAAPDGGMRPAPNEHTCVDGVRLNRLEHGTLICRMRGGLERCHEAGPRPNTRRARVGAAAMPRASAMPLAAITGTDRPRRPPRGPEPWSTFVPTRAHQTRCPGRLPRRRHRQPAGELPPRSSIPGYRADGYWKCP
jgi:hypothetical protein